MYDQQENVVLVHHCTVQMLTLCCFAVKKYICQHKNDVQSATSFLQGILEEDTEITLNPL